MIRMICAVLVDLILASCQAGDIESRSYVERQDEPYSGKQEQLYRFYVELQNEAYSGQQEQLYREFSETNDSGIRDRDAYILSELWKANLLRNDIKDRLVDYHYRLVLLQVYGNYQAPNFVVRCYQTFPFPSVWTRFTPILYINNKVVWAPESPQLEKTMSVNNSTITSRIGGVVRNGDVVQYQVKIDQAINNEIVWEKTIWTNPVVAQDLKQDRENCQRVATPDIQQPQRRSNVENKDFNMKK